MKRREVKRHRITQVFHHPVAEFFGFIYVVVFVRNHQIGDLKPNVGFVLEPFQRIQHGFKMGKRQLVIEALGKRFEIDVGGVNVAINLRSRFGSDVDGGDHYAFNSSLARHTGYVDNEFAPDHRIVISKGNARYFTLDRQFDDLLRTRVQALRLVEFRLADAPVLAETASQIAASGAEAQDFAARQEMIERFFFDGIDGKAGRSSVAERVELAADVLANVAKAGLAFSYPAKARAKRAEYLAVGFGMPPQGFLHRQNIPLL